MATNLNKIIKRAEVSRKIYLSLFSAQLKFLNFKAKRGNSAIRRKEKIKEVMSMFKLYPLDGPPLRLQRTIFRTWPRHGGCCYFSRNSADYASRLFRSK